MQTVLLATAWMDTREARKQARKWAGREAVEKFRVATQSGRMARSPEKRSATRRQHQSSRFNSGGGEYGSQVRILDCERAPVSSFMQVTAGRAARF